MQIIKGVNTLRSTYTERYFTQNDIQQGAGILNKLVIEAPFKESAWALSLIISDNSTIHCEIEDTKITFS